MCQFEWKVVVQLRPVLAGFLNATTRMSESNTCLITDVIPLIDALHDSLVNVAADASKYRAIHHAAQRGISALNKYYSLTDESYLSQFVLLLHPMFKMEYMQDQEWEQDWIDRAVTLLRETWQTKYAPTPSPTMPSASTPTPATDFTAGDQLETYLSEPVLNVIDPLAYWNEKRLSGACPELAQMALDYLTIPATSVDVERAFSFGCHTVSLYRHSLSKSTIRDSGNAAFWDKGKKRAPAPTPSKSGPGAPTAPSTTPLPSAVKPKKPTFAEAAKAFRGPSLPKVALPMRSKAKDPLSAAFKPLTPIAPEAQASGIVVVKHINRLLAPSHFQLKGCA
ncbi:hypothetical protein BOTBODRAFT_170759 [Botryobasidium botryosum FD-172 SS1]|uniref:HAT C-terminal dimerisation domain-containing protein n=1 Tax=Botryobasidium botryosum (strain FD-172 SS1) TaxID=930990 RepID=A0A067MVD1_BOTB1|nr:hypothetical protein BOTBODRAFT_170759 [Botryobasidium botryosum FD-172 SS1]